MGIDFMRVEAVATYHYGFFPQGESRLSPVLFLFLKISGVYVINGIVQQVSLDTEEQDGKISPDSGKQTQICP
jgi:hypothetical protein